MTEYERPEIVPMTPDTMQDMLVVRKRVFCEEMLTSGVPEANVVEHVKGWDRESAAAEAIKEWVSWLDRPQEFYMRRVTLGTESVGLLMATLFDLEFDGAKCLDVIQLDHRVRGLGVGRSLVEDLVEVDDPTKAVYLRVLAGNKPALGFYDRVGFLDTGGTGVVNIGGFNAGTKLLVKKGRKT